jgi:hypothetical protein
MSWSSCSRPRIQLMTSNLHLGCSAQFSNSLSGEQEVDPSAPHPDSSMAANATAQKERSTPEALAGTPRSMLMSPQMVRRYCTFADWYIGRLLGPKSVLQCTGA